MNLQYLKVWSMNKTRQQVDNIKADCITIYWLTIVKLITGNQNKLTMTLNSNRIILSLKSTEFNTECYKCC